MDKRDCRGSEGSKSDCVFPVRFGIKPDLFYYSHIKSRKKRQIRFSFLFFFGWNAHVCLPLTCYRRRMLIWLLISDMEPPLRRMSRRSIFHFPRRENASMHTPTRAHTRTHKTYSHTYAHTQWHLGPGKLLTRLVRPGGAQSVALLSGSALTAPVTALPHPRVSRRQWRARLARYLMGVMNK